MMKTITFYRWALLTPVAVPLMLLPFISGDSGIAKVAELFWLSLIYGGLPYVLTLALFARPLINGSERLYNLLSWIAPLLVITVQVTGGFLVGFCVSVTDRWGGATSTAGFMLILGMYTLAFGYGYVSLTHSGLWLLRRFGLVH